MGLEVKGFKGLGVKAGAQNGMYEFYVWHLRKRTST
jgi:hypothetical protein